MVECVADFHFARLKSFAKEKDDAGIRSQNPAVLALCRTLADMEEADECVVTSYGLGAILSLCLSQLKRGDHILVARGCFGAHARAFEDYMQSYGVAITFIAGFDADAWLEGICPTTRMAFIATLADSTVEVQARQIRELSRVFREAGHAGQSIQLVVENSHRAFGRVRPLQYGADFVLYTSAHCFETQGSVVAGAICGRRTPMSDVARCMKDAHICVSPFNAWSLLRGLGADRSEVLDHILGVGSTDDSDTVAWLPSKDLDQHHEPSPQ